MTSWKRSMTTVTIGLIGRPLLPLRTTYPLFSAAFFVTGNTVSVANVPKGATTIFARITVKESWYVRSESTKTYSLGFGVNGFWLSFSTPIFSAANAKGPKSEDLRPVSTNVRIFRATCSSTATSPSIPRVNWRPYCSGIAPTGQ